MNLGPQAQKPSQQTRTEQEQAGRPAARTQVSNNVDTHYPDNRPSGPGGTGISTASSSGQQQSKPAPPANSQAGVIEPLYETKKTFKALPTYRAQAKGKPVDEVPGVELDP